MRYLNKRHTFRPVLEALETRLAPATLVNATTLTYRDVDGDAVTVTSSLPVFSAGTINNAFKFSVGDVTGSNATPQQLQLIDSTSLAVSGATLKVKAVAANGGDGLVNVGYINASGLDLTKVKVAGDLGHIDVGDATTTTPGLGALKVRSIGKLGATTQATGGNLNTTIQGALGLLAIQTDLESAFIKVAGGQFDAKIGQITIGGSLLGAGIANSGRIEANAVGPIVIQGNIVGSTGNGSGAIRVFGALASLTVGGSVLGGAAQDSGSVVAVVLGPVSIGGDLVGGNAAGAGAILSPNSDIARVTVGGSLIGGAGLISGGILASGNLGPVVVGGSVLGGPGKESGSLSALTGRIASVTVGGSVQSGTGLRSGSIRAGDDVGPILIRGSLVGSSAQPVVISARGQAAPAGATDLAIASLTVKGRGEFANILAGYSTTLVPQNADAQIGAILVKGDWITSNLVAGAVAGNDGFFGTADDAKISGAGTTDSPEIISKIGSVIIVGAASGTAATGDHFGIVAELVKALTDNGQVESVATGPHNDNLGFGTFGDFALREV